MEKSETDAVLIGAGAVELTIARQLVGCGHDTVIMENNELIDMGLAPATAR